MDSSAASSPSSANTQAAAAHRTSANNNASNQANINGMVRYAQLRDLSNHQLCKEHNQQALLAERMAKLGALVKELEETDWMFDRGRDKTRPIGLSRGVEERW